MVAETSGVYLGVEPEFANVISSPEKAIQLREEYEDVRPGWHMNKKHWNTVHFEGELESSMLRALIDHSYDLVVDGLPKKTKDLLASL